MDVLLLFSSMQSANCGVNALAHGTINVLAQRYDEMDFTILFPSNKEMVEHQIALTDEKGISVRECSLSFRLEIMVLLNILTFGLYQPRKPFFRQSFNVWKDADLILDFSSGDSFTDIYGIKRFIKISLIKLGTIWARKRLVLMPQTLGPFRRRWTRTVAGYIVRNVQYAFFRDEESFQMAANDFSVKPDKCSCIMDMGFYVRPSSEQDVIDFVDTIRKNGRILIGINVSGLLCKGGYTQNNMFDLKTDYNQLIRRIIEYYLTEQKDTDIILTPHVISKAPVIEDDLTASLEIYHEYYKRFPNRIYLADRFFKEDQLKCIIGSCDFFIGSRMHACIAAISSGVPTVAIAYSKKFIGVWSMIGLSDCVSDPRTEDMETILTNIKNKFLYRDSIVPEIRDDSAALYEVIDNF